MRRQCKTYLVFTIILSLGLSSCSRNPLRHRLAQNFIYNCALGLIDEGVAPIEADQICRSAHASEIHEGQIKSEKNKELAKESRDAASKITDSIKSKEDRSPASIPAP